MLSDQHAASGCMLADVLVRKPQEAVDCSAAVWSCHAAVTQNCKLTRHLPPGYSTHSVHEQSRACRAALAPATDLPHQGISLILA